MAVYNFPSFDPGVPYAGTHSNQPPNKYVVVNVYNENPYFISA